MAKMKLANVFQRFDIDQVRLIASESKLEIIGGKLPTNTQILIQVEVGHSKDEKKVICNPKCVVQTRYESSDDPSIVIAVTYQVVLKLTDGERWPRITKELEREFMKVGVFTCWPYIRQAIQATSVAMNLKPLSLPLIFPTDKPDRIRLGSMGEVVLGQDTRRQE